MKTERYAARGVTGKKAVHKAVSTLDKGLFPGAFCKILPDYLDGKKDKCVIMHADGSGSKLTLAYLVWKLSGEMSVWDGIVQDSVVMNIDDCICVGATGPFIVSSTLGRNTFNLPDEVVERLIIAGERFCEKMTRLGITCYMAGGETADLPNQTGTAIIDHTVVTKMMRKDVINAANITPGGIIVGFSTTGKADWEEAPNSGMGSNGLTSAIHDLLHRVYRKHKETYGREQKIELVFSGSHLIDDGLPGDDHFTVAEALLSPTRTYAPLVKEILNEIGEKYVQGMIHCSGKGQTKARYFGQEGIEYVKEDLFDVPPLFKLLIAERDLPMREAYETYNMGHRFEAIFGDQRVAEECIALAEEMGIGGKIIGRVRQAKKLPRGAKRKVTIMASDVVEEYFAF